MLLEDWFGNPVSNATSVKFTVLISGETIAAGAPRAQTLARRLAVQLADGGERTPKGDRAIVRQPGRGATLDFAYATLIYGAGVDAPLALARGGRPWTH